VQQLRKLSLFDDDALEGVMMDVQTPDSVVRHPTQRSPSPPELQPTVPERIATIKASGGKLKARPSATPADLAAMAAARRHVSIEASNPPPIPERHRDRPSSGHRTSEDKIASQTSENKTDGVHANEKSAAGARRKSVRKSLIKLDVPVGSLADDLSLGLDKEFDRLLDTQKVSLQG
jgi:hypothetical protein